MSVPASRPAGSGAEPLARHVAGPLRVTYADTDRMGFVYHSNYFIWFEIGRTELLRAVGGTSYRDWEEKEGVFLPVSSCWADFRKAARYDDLIEVATAVTQISRVSITFEYEVRPAGGGDVLAVGGTRHAFTDGNGRIVRAADRLLPELFAPKAK